MSTDVASPADRPTPGAADDRRRRRARRRPAPAACGGAWAHSSTARVVDSDAPGQRPRPGRRRWWIPAEAVWSDADGDAQPQHPRHVGLATGRTADERRARRPQRPARLGGRSSSCERGPRAARPRRHSPASGADDVDRRRRTPRPRRPDRGHRRRRHRRAGVPGATGRRPYHRALYGDDGSRRRPRTSWPTGRLLGRPGLGRRGRRPRHAGDPPGRCRALLGAADWSPHDDPGRSWDAEPGQLIPVAAVVNSTEFELARVQV